MDLSQLLFATSNVGKLAEAKRFAEQHGLSLLGISELLDQKDLGPIPDVVEDGVTFLENAAKKAREYSLWAGVPVIADDSGLEVAALHGAPGINTARYAGAQATSDDNIEKLLEELGDREARQARFVCALALVNGADLILSAQGKLKGRITTEPRGRAGFGYDPIFQPEGMGKTLAELKGVVAVETHRTRALKQLFESLALS